jgi:Neuraminidase (sialidase)
MEQGGKGEIVVSHSTDGGVTWTQVAVDPVQTYPEEDDFTRLAVGKDGTVYVTWLHCRGKSGSGGALCPTVHTMFSKSTDGGNTWSSAQRIATVAMPHYWLLPNTKYGERVYNYPVIGVDNGNRLYSGSLYVAMYSWTGTYMRVQVIRSTDDGKTWSQPVPLAPKTDTHDQFFPAISVSPSGLVGVSWLDRRNDPGNHKFQAFAAFSNDGGKRFNRNWQLTKAFSDPDVGGPDGFMGDYTGNTWSGGNFIAAWMDSSNGTDMQEVIGGIRLH